MELFIKVKQIGEAKHFRKLGDMGIGEVGYITPWMYDPITGLLDTNCHVRGEAFGSANLKIKRTSKTDYQVYMDGCNFIYPWKG